MFWVKGWDLCIYYLFYWVGARITSLCSAAAAFTGLSTFHAFPFQCLWKFVTRIFSSKVLTITSSRPTHRIGLYHTMIVDRVHGLGRGQELWEYPPLRLVKYMRKYSSVSRWPCRSRVKKKSMGLANIDKSDCPECMCVAEYERPNS